MEVTLPEEPYPSTTILLRNSDDDVGGRVWALLLGNGTILTYRLTRESLAEPFAFDLGWELRIPPPNSKRFIFWTAHQQLLSPHVWMNRFELFKAAGIDILSDVRAADALLRNS